MENNTVKVIVPAVEYTTAIYDASSNTYMDVERFNCIGEKPAIPAGHEIIKTRRVRLIADMPINTVLSFLKEE